MVNHAEYCRALSFFDAPAQSLLRAYAEKIAGTVCELRLYARKAALLQTDESLLFCHRDGTLRPRPEGALWAPDGEALLRVLNRAAAFSLFLHEEELRQGFVTANGCRIGICGVGADGKIGAGGISSLHIRIPYIVERTVCPLLERVLKAAGGVLIAGPPGSGKTTLLKRMIFYFCSGAAGRYETVSVIDPRGEFANAVLEDDCVVSADLVSGKDKTAGMETAVRLLSPEVMICDEIGSPEEARKLQSYANAGVRVCASVHAGSVGELARKKHLLPLIGSGVFRHVLLLSAVEKGKIDRIFFGEETKDAICGCAAAEPAVSGARASSGGAAAAAGRTPVRVL